MNNLYVIYIMNKMVSDCKDIKLDIYYKNNVKISK